MDQISNLVEVEIEPETEAEKPQFDAALRRLLANDPTLRIRSHMIYGRTLLSGNDESHLDTALTVLRCGEGITIRFGAPQVAYREKLMRRTEIDYTHKKQTGGSGQFAKVKIVYSPNEAGAGNVFESQIVGGAVPKEFVPGVEKGIASVTGSGVLAGFPVVDLKAALVDGAYHDVDSSVLAFEIAARAATREALQKGQSVLLEPIMKVEVVTPENCRSSVIGDLNSRRGQIQGQHMRGNAVVINAMVPLANMFGYVNQLRSLSQGRAVFIMRFDHYEQVPIGTGHPPFRPAAAMRSVSA